MKNKNLYEILEFFEEFNSLFLTGGAGVGKSFISNQVIQSYKKIDKKDIN